jgi:hypothetical protein
MRKIIKRSAAITDPSGEPAPGAAREGSPDEGTDQARRGAQCLVRGRPRRRRSHVGLDDRRPKR